MLHQTIQSKLTALLIPFIALGSFALSSCGGSGTVPYPGVLGQSGTLGTVMVTTSSGTSIANIQAGQRALSPEFSKRRAVAYSPYRTTAGPNAEVVTATQITEDLNLLIAANLKLIRLFDSSDMVAKQTLQIIRQNNLDIKVMLGAYIIGSKYVTNSATLTSIETANQAELARMVNLANTFSDIVLTASIGNENMVNWSGNAETPAKMAGYITQVRNHITQPVTTDDNFAFFAGINGNNEVYPAITNVIDFISMHTYAIQDSIPYAGAPTTWTSPWDWIQKSAAPGLPRATAMINAAIEYTHSNYDAVQSNMATYALANKFPIVIGETGWKSIASGGEAYRAHPVNQGMYYQSLLNWAAGAGSNGPRAIVYFEAFDEPWKGGDDKWGLFNVNRQARYALYSQTSPSVCVSCAQETPLYTASQATYVPPIGTSISANQYSVFDNPDSSSAVNASSPLSWIPWNVPWTVSYASYASSFGPGSYLQVTPTPATWGWGIQYQFANQLEDLSKFASGHLNVRINTKYAGSIELGFITVNGAGAYMPIKSGQYGFVNDGQWHLVSIPVSDLTSHSTGGKPDLSLVSIPFVMADVYTSTGNTPGSNAPINIDTIYWTQN
jgi:exo-beta-1,3-glucanase (GH17 family)